MYRWLFLCFYVLCSPIALAKENDPRLTELQDLNNQVEALYQKERYEEAVPFLAKAVKISQEVFGEVHPSTATSYNNLGSLYKALGKYEEALSLYQKTLAIQQEVLGEKHPETVTSYNNMGDLYEALGKCEEALPLYQEALTIQQEVLGEKRPNTASSYNNMGVLYFSLAGIKMPSFSTKRSLLFKKNDTKDVCTAKTPLRKTNSDS